MRHLGKVPPSAASRAAHLHIVPGTGPTTVNGKVAPPRRVPNAERRTREHLAPTEVDALMAAAGRLGRHGHRDATLILLAYRHGLRVGELVALRWDQVDLKIGLLHVARLKHGAASTHPLRGPELRALRRLQRHYPGFALPAHDRARRAAHRLGGPQDHGASRRCIGVGLPRASAHAAARLRLQTCERWPRYAGDSALPWTPEHPAHGPVH